VRLRGPLAGALTKLSGLIPERLAPLESASFDRLHHNVRGSALPVMTWRAAAPAISRLVRIAAFD
jgi:hypothetical protein